MRSAVLVSGALLLAGCRGLLGFEEPVVGDAGALTVGFREATSATDEGAGTHEVVVTLSQATDVSVEVDVTTAPGGSAARGADFTLDTTTVTIPAGAVQATVPLTILADATEEPAETIRLELRGARGAVLGATQHEVTIASDVLPRVRFVDIDDQVAENATRELEVMLDRTSAVEVSVEFTVAGTASAADHGLVAGTLVFQPGELDKKILLSALDDTLDENDETVEVTLANPSSGLVLGNDTMATVTIADDDLPPVVQFQLASSSVTEANTTVTVTVVLSTPSGKQVTVPFVRTGNAANNVDFALVTQSPINFTAGTSSRTIQINVVQDINTEQDETVILTLGAPTNASLGTPDAHTLTIVDND